MFVELMLYKTKNEVIFKKIKIMLFLKIICLDYFLILGWKVQISKRLL